MSTRYTLAHGEEFHLYRDCMDEDHVFLQLAGPRFSYEDGSVTLAIPLEVWEAVRQKSCVQIDEDLLGKTDEQLLEKVQDFVAKRPKEGIARIFGVMAYGGADLPPEQQIAHGLAYYKEKRDKQADLLTRIAALLEANP
jgi:hypothetical protein